MDTQTYSEAVNAYYTPGDLGAAIQEGLRRAGKNPDAPALDDLAPVDQFHTGGKAATLELAQIANLTPGTRVLDVGGGIGGAARLLASQMGCEVTVIDLTEAYCQVGEMLTRQAGLSERVSFQQGNALDLPYADHAFDAVWTQHSTMNIADKARLYTEVARVLRPGGRLAFHEIMAGPNTPIHFPVPWATDGHISFLWSPDELCALLTSSGWKERAWVDKTAAARAFFEERMGLIERATGSLPPLGLHLLLGERFVPAFQNTLRNLQQQRLTVIQAVFERA
ncbi:MAG: class I SAM-dependent methyltransferase [Nitrososphaerota archaeon]